MFTFQSIPVGLVSLLLLAAGAAAHGIADGITVYPKGGPAGTYYRGYNPSFQFQTPPPEVVGWSTPDNLQNGFVSPAQYASAEIICHLGATPAALAVPVNGGDDVGIHWDTWPDSHKGPVVDSLANCNGPCQGVDKTKLEFFEIGRQAVVDAAADLWAPNVIVKDGLTWFVRIPEGLAPGNYVLRHEIVALHAAGQVNGAQNYPFCFNLAVSSSGTDTPPGRSVSTYYEASEPGIVWDLFGQKAADYPMPGPVDNLYSGAETASQRMPSITATGTGIKSLDIAALPPKETSTTVTTPAPVVTSEAVPEVPAVPSTTEEAVVVVPSLPTSSEATSTTSVTTSEEAPDPTPEAEEAEEEEDGARTVDGTVYTTVFVTTLVTVTEVSTTVVYSTVTVPSR